MCAALLHCEYTHAHTHRHIFLIFTDVQPFCLFFFLGFGVCPVFSRTRRSCKHLCPTCFGRAHMMYTPWILQMLARAHESIKHARAGAEACRLNAEHAMLRARMQSEKDRVREWERERKKENTHECVYRNNTNHRVT